MFLQRPFIPIFLVILLSFFSTCSCQKKNNLDHEYHQNVTASSYSSSLASISSNLPRIVNVDRYGAKADGTDDFKAFMNAWKDVCSSSRKSVLLIPRNRVYHLKPITFSGPCKSNIEIQILGTIKASNKPSDYQKNRRLWIMFENIDNFLVGGGGTINGNGQIWWKRSCKVNENLPCLGAPTAVTFSGCKNLRVNNIRIKNAQQMHMNFQDCLNVLASNVVVVSPENSPNTDGIHVTGTRNIQIVNSVMRTGDDCISIVSGSKNVKATNIICGPGHGISIGSLGKDNSEDQVSDIIVDGAKISNATNGVRIKTWQGGRGYARNIQFHNIVMQNVSNPIIIDQNYCDREKACPQQKSAVQVTNVVYNNIKGTSSTEEAIKFSCSKTFPCKGIVLQTVDILRVGGGNAEASCKNIWFDTKARGRVSPHCP